MLPSYVLVTAVRNEAKFIELTLKSVVAQTVQPMKWVVVSDGSTDGTDEIVKRYANSYPWIELIRMPERRERSFAGKVHAFNAGYATLASLEYDVIGNLDGDVSFEPDYLANLLCKFEENANLGVAGTPYREHEVTYDYRFASLEDVPGVCQLFRRKCFEDIGGYLAVKGGNVDSIAVMTARMKGWQTKTFMHQVCIHHRESGTAQGSPLRARFKRGVKAYAVGNHPVWELCRTAYQMTRKPLVIGGLALLTGYLWSVIRRPGRPVSAEFVAFHRREQMHRLRQILTGRSILARKTLGA